MEHIVDCKSGNSWDLLNQQEGKDFDGSMLISFHKKKKQQCPCCNIGAILVQYWCPLYNHQTCPAFTVDTDLRLMENFLLRLQSGKVETEIFETHTHQMYKNKFWITV